MKMTVCGDENMLSLQIGQLASVALSMHLWSSLVDIEIHAQHVYNSEP